MFDLRNISPIDINKTEGYVRLADTFGMSVKRHNCDFHTEKELILLKNIGIKAYNFAPEFSAIYNQNIYENLKPSELNILNTKIIDAPWDRWINNPDDSEKLYKSCLHYIQDPIIEDVTTENLKNKIKKEIQLKINQILDCIN